MTLRNRVLDQRVARAEIEQVILVDAWRHEQDRRLFHLICLRRVLNELDQLVLENHGPGCDGQVASDFESGLVDPGDPALLQIVDQILHTVREACGPGLDRLADHLWIGRGEIRRTHRVDELTGIKPKLQSRLVVHLRPVDEFMQLS